MSKIYLAISTDTATDIETKFDKPVAADTAGAVSSFEITSGTYTEQGASTSLCSISDTPEDDFKTAFLAKYGSYPSTKSADFFRADMINTVWALQNPEDHHFLVPVKSENARWFFDIFKSSLGKTNLNEITKYPNQDYYKFDLDFTDTTPSDSQKIQLAAYAKKIDDENLGSEINIGTKYGPDMLSLYLFAKDNPVDEAPVAATAVVSAQNPTDKFTISDDLKKLLGERDIAYLQRGDDTTTRQELLDFKTKINEPATWYNPWSSSYRENQKYLISAAIDKILTP